MHPSGFVQTITCTINNGFQNNLAQLLPLRGRNAILNIFRWVEGLGHRGQIKVKMVIYMYGACPGHNCTFMHGFQNDFAQLLPSSRRSAI